MPYLHAEGTRMKVYECHNQACPMGTATQPGRFSGGVTYSHLALTKGDPIPPGVDPSESIVGHCPSCGEKGKPAGTDKPHETVGDPLDHIHREIRDKRFDQARELVDLEDLPPLDKARLLRGIAHAEYVADEGGD